VSLDTTEFATTTSKGFTIASSHHPGPLQEAVRDALTHYFDQLESTPPSDLYQLVIQQVERPLFESVMQYTGGNQSRAATLLGISRSTLRKKLAQFGID
jgi:Fis family transcriptional regulator